MSSDYSKSDLRDLNRLRFRYGHYSSIPIFSNGNYVDKLPLHTKQTCKEGHTLSLHLADQSVQLLSCDLKSTHIPQPKHICNICRNEIDYIEKSPSNNYTIPTISMYKCMTKNCDYTLCPSCERSASHLSCCTPYAMQVQLKAYVADLELRTWKTKAATIFIQYQQAKQKGKKKLIETCIQLFENEKKKIMARIQGDYLKDPRLSDTEHLNLSTQIFCLSDRIQLLKQATGSLELIQQIQIPDVYEMLPSIPLVANYHLYNTNDEISSKLLQSQNQFVYNRGSNSANDIFRRHSANEGINMQGRQLLADYYNNERNKNYTQNTTVTRATNINIQNKIDFNKTTEENISIQIKNEGNNKNVSTAGTKMDRQQHLQQSLAPEKNEQTVSSKTTVQSTTTTHEIDLPLTMESIQKNATFCRDYVKELNQKEAQGNGMAQIDESQELQAARKLVIKFEHMLYEEMALQKKEVEEYVPGNTHTTNISKQVMLDTHAKMIKMAQNKINTIIEKESSSTTSTTKINNSNPYNLKYNQNFVPSLHSRIVSVRDVPSLIALSQCNKQLLDKIFTYSYSKREQRSISTLISTLKKNEKQDQIILNRSMQRVQAIQIEKQMYHVCSIY